MASTFFRDAAKVVNNIDITLHYKVLRNHVDCVSPGDYLPGTEFCLHDPQGVISGELLLNEVVRQHCIFSTQGLSQFLEYMTNFYLACSSSYTQECSDEVIDDSTFSVTTAYTDCISTNIAGGLSSKISEF